MTMMVYLFFGKFLSIVSSAVPIVIVLYWIISSICFVNLCKILIICNESKKKLKISRKINIFKNIFEKFQSSSSNEGQKHNSKLSKWKSWFICTGITPFQGVNNYCIRMQFQSSHQGSHMIRQNVCTGCLNNKSQFFTKCISGLSG